jgi:transposase
MASVLDIASNVGCSRSTVIPEPSHNPNHPRHPQHEGKACGKAPKSPAASQQGGKHRGEHGAISDMGLGMFRQMLTYKAVRDGARITVADRWFPSSRLCRQCGVINETLTLADRVFVCPACGFTDDRDFHAADNLERYPGLQGNPNAPGHRSAGLSVGIGETVMVEGGTIESVRLDTF